MKWEKREEEELLSVAKFAVKRWDRIYPKTAGGKVHYVRSQVQQAANEMLIRKGDFFPSAVMRFLEKLP
jgi:hypothetical protein